jgi:hypothetical protein
MKGVFFPGVAYLTAENTEENLKSEGKSEVAVKAFNFTAGDVEERRENRISNLNPKVESGSKKLEMG